MKAGTINPKAIGQGYVAFVNASNLFNSIRSCSASAYSNGKSYPIPNSSALVFIPIEALSKSFLIL